MTAKHLHIFRHLFSPVIQNICVKEKKKDNSILAVMSQGQMGFFVSPGLSKFCSSVTSDARLKASSCFSLLLLFHHPQPQREWISHKMRKDMGHVDWKKLKGVQLKWELGFLLKKEERNWCGAPWWQFYKVLFWLRQCFDDRRKTWSAKASHLLSAPVTSLSAGVLHGTAKDHPSKLRTWAVAAAFGRREEGRKYLFAQLDFIKFHPFQWKKCFEAHTRLSDLWHVLPDVMLALVRSHLPKHSTEVEGASDFEKWKREGACPCRHPSS